MEPNKDRDTEELIAAIKDLKVTEPVLQRSILGSYSWVQPKCILIPGDPVRVEKNSSEG